MEKDIILIASFLLTGLIFIGPREFLSPRLEIIKRPLSMIAVVVTLALLIYCIWVEPFSISFILFLIAAGLILEGLKTAPPHRLFKFGLFSLFLMSLFFFLKFSWLAEAAAASAFIFLLSGFVSRLVQNFYDD